MVGLFASLMATETAETNVAKLNLERCANTRFRSVECRACEMACPTAAISDAAVNPERCINCGVCASVCKSDAIDGVKPAQRRFDGPWLLLNAHEFIGIDELAYWCRSKKLAGIWVTSQDEALVARATALVHQLNQRKDGTLNALSVRQQARVDLAKRRWLRSANDAGSRAKQAFSTSAPSAIYAKGFSIALDSEQCNACMACVNVCDSQAITTQDQKFQIDSDKCIGCHHCTAACPEAALELSPRDYKRQNQIQVLTIHECQCQNCRRSFNALDANAQLCGVCESATELDMKE
ncbi:4Fe-4S binding protein [Paraferrimonas sedimenticola]|uniref:4Fe-4S ferredoxin-type domain-containing protein n=1 Tax=Paraferrimonas sedimenticola TaxID=375674 RepID=A0AA37RVA1_9GAMM|nr:4Fe-4S binding protein [Paraferrimonas sedimenticola]GLP95688.1 hypothetical protein GCM10007895_09940 [Paraferrimonas sedimenticola]